MKTSRNSAKCASRPAVPGEIDLIKNDCSIAYACVWETFTVSAMGPRISEAMRGMSLIFFVAAEPGARISSGESKALVESFV